MTEIGLFEMISLNSERVIHPLVKARNINLLCAAFLDEISYLHLHKERPVILVAIESAC